MAFEPDPKTPRRQSLEEAADLIDGDRNKSYGSPTQNFENIAEMWTTFLKHKLKDGETLDASDVADLMILLKIARNIASKKHDTYVDVAGYAGCGAEIIAEPEPEPDKPKLKPGGIVGPDTGKSTGPHITFNHNVDVDPKLLARDIKEAFEQVRRAQQGRGYM